MNTEGAIETSQLIVGESKVWVTWGPCLQLVSEVMSPSPEEFTTNSK